MKALVIDDSASARAVMKAILEKNNFDVVEAENGLAALDQVNKDPSINLALVDWNMPVMDGLQFVEKIRENTALSGIELIMVTTENEVKNISKALDSGARDYIIKPFTEESIVQAVKVAGL